MKEKEPVFTLRDKLDELKDVFWSGCVSINELSDMVNSTPSQVNQLINMNGVIKSTHELIDWTKVMEDRNKLTVGDWQTMTEEQRQEYLN